MNLATLAIWLVMGANVFAAEENYPKFTPAMTFKQAQKKAAGSETVQMYISDMEASVERPEKELKGFKKVFLQPGETKEVTLLIDKKDLSFYHPEKKIWMCEKGSFEVKVGNASDNILLTTGFDL